LIATCDQTGPHLFATEPSGNYYEYGATAIGSRSQTSRTYLEKEFENFASATLDELIKHALKALAASLAGDSDLDAKSASVIIVGIDHPYKIIEDDAVQPYLDAIELEQGPVAGSSVTEEMDLDNLILETPDV
jgi:20S proteasome subunit alpha 6